VPESTDPDPDPLLTDSGGVPISQTVHFPLAYTPVVTASLELYSSTASGQAECALWEQHGSTASKLSQNGVVDFRAVNDNEHLTLVGEVGESTATGGNGFAADLDFTYEVRCSVASGTIKYERGDLVVVGIPL
jgi:hypothetical protein